MVVKTPTPVATVPDQHLVGDRGHLVGQHLQIGLRDGDDRAHRKAHGGDPQDALALYQPAADALAERRHCDFRAQLKKTHADDQEDCSCEKQHEGSDLHGHDRNAQEQHDGGDRQHARQGLLDFFFQFLIHFA